MMQSGAIILNSTSINFEFPSPKDEVIPGVKWGSVDAFPTPAYWAYQVLARKMTGNVINYKLGETLKEEVGACILGGHGIPASIGIAAFQHLKSLGAFSKEGLTEDNILQWLSKPIMIDGKSIKYRFARQKSRYLASAFNKLENDTPPTLSSGKELRNWLLDITGVGLKTASWIARNWLSADDVAILDIHILRAGILGGFFTSKLSIEKDYLELEEIFIQFSEHLGVRASELDSVIWLEMMSSQASIKHIFSFQDAKIKKKPQTSKSPQKSKTDTMQTSFLV